MSFGAGGGELDSTGVALGLLRRELEQEPERCLVTGSGGLPACDRCWPCKRERERQERKIVLERLRAWWRRR